MLGQIVPAFLLRRLKMLNKNNAKSPVLSSKEDLKLRIDNVNKTFMTNPKEYLELIKFQSKFYRYSSRNTKLIYSQNPKAAFIASFKHWMDLGYTVLKGEKGIKILVPIMSKFIQLENGDVIKYSSATKEQQKLANSGQIPIIMKQNFKVGNVFDIMQTNCPKSDYPKFLIGYPSIEHEKLYQAVKMYAEEKLHCPINEENFNSLSYRGNYNIENHSIKYNSVLDSTQKLSTTIHEISHSILHAGISIGTDKIIEQVELEADSLSLMMHEQLGIEPTPAMQHHLLSQYSCLKESKYADKIIESLDFVTNKYHEIANDFAESINKYIQQQNTIQQSLDVQTQSNLEQENVNEILNMDMNIEM